ncbi:MAG: hypothetical protein QF845_06920 [Candidatus Marinimicrobia bacterium]|jgi:hypothetical protein|nr:hypothetical protein [Candidatus Neomarinimicrobiota bacterium]MDP7071471.1 hypothetical protein [Candidatus Neomarinimicrobiota bacterium]
MAENSSKSNTPLLLTGALVAIFLALIFTRDQWGADDVSGTIGKRKSVEKQQFQKGDVALGENDARLSRLMQNKTFSNLVTSGEFASLIANADFNNLISDARFQSLMADPGFAALIASPAFKALEGGLISMSEESSISAESLSDQLGQISEDQIIQGADGSLSLQISNEGSDVATTITMISAGGSSLSGSGGGSNISQSGNLSGDSDGAAVLTAVREFESLLGNAEFAALYNMAEFRSLMRSAEFSALLMAPNFKSILTNADFKNILSAGEFHSMLLNPGFRSLAGMPMDK